MMLPGEANKAYYYRKIAAEMRKTINSQRL
jgi:hypothetical protein